MRLDIFLKESRLIKRRPKAKEFCEAGRISVNDIRAKSGKEVSVGDTLLIKYPSKHLTVQIVALPRRGMPPTQASECYRITEERKLSPQEMWMEE